MATSPSTHALGALGDIARPSAGKPSAKADDNTEKPHFSDVLQDARGSRPEPQQRPADAKQPRDQPVARDEKVASTAPRDPAPVAQKSAPTAAKKPQTGNELPPDGEELPVAETVSDLLAKLIGGGETDTDGKTTATGADVDKDKTKGDAAVVDPLLTAPVVAVIPENVVTSAAAALATRGVQQGSSEDGQATTGISDATTAQKREDPTATQTLSTLAAPLSGTTPPVEATPEAVAAAAANANANSKGVATATADAIGSDVATGVDADSSGIGDGLTLDKQAQHKTAEPRFAGDPKAAVAMLGDNASQSGGAAIAVGGTEKSTADSERASFRDTLKQIDTTLAGPSTKGSDTAPVTTTRESGLRQYLDSSTAATKVDVPVGKQGWSDAVAGKVMWMSSQNLSSAEIELNPPDLGPMSVRVSSHQDQTSVYFTSTHAQVREALDQSLPRLREMMGNQGIQLLDVGVGGQGSMRDQRAFSGDGNSGGNGNSRGGGGSGDTRGDAEIGSVTRTTISRARPGLLDAYA